MERVAFVSMMYPSIGPLGVSGYDQRRMIAVEFNGEAITLVGSRGAVGSVTTVPASAKSPGPALVYALTLTLYSLKVCRSLIRTVYKLVLLSKVLGEASNSAAEKFCFDELVFPVSKYLTS